MPVLYTASLPGHYWRPALCPGGCERGHPGTTIADLRQRLPATRVLVLTTYADEDAIVPALRAGARGYLTKDASAEQIEAAIHAVHAGQT